MPREAKTIEDTCHHSSVLQQWPRPLEAGPDRPPPQRQQHHSTSRLLLCKRGNCVRSSPVDRPGHCPRRQVNSSVAQHIHLLTSTREAGPDRPPPVSPPTAHRPTSDTRPCLSRPLRPMYSVAVQTVCPPGVHQSPRCVLGVLDGFVVCFVIGPCYAWC